MPLSLSSVPATGRCKGQSSPIRTMGRSWVVTQGLAANEKVITQGTSNLKDGAQIKPVPASAPEKIQAPPPGAMKAAGKSRRG